MNGDAPLASILLIAYQQERTVAEAVAGALSQTYSPLEIILSDDASSDGTFAAMQAAVASYTGPHRIVLNRNPQNLGIGAHLSHLVSLSKGEMLCVAAGDDVSLPQRCETVMAAWRASGQRLDLIAAALIDIDESGRTGAVITPSDLGTYHNAADWLARPPFVVGAAQAWTRRVFERFGPLPKGVVAEDLVMVLRAVMSGGAVTLAEPLVRYRRGGLSFRRRAQTAADVVKALLKNNRSSLVELPLLLDDARKADQLAALEPALRARLARELFVRDLFAATSLPARCRVVLSAQSVPLALRLRLFVYAACPALLAPFFWLKRSVRRAR
ncbi:MAG: glycosyltransferase [Burkholderiales bacterium]|nr:glycosyltransferase [Burkholderiales bacterium]